MAIAAADVGVNNSSVNNAYGDANASPRIPWSNNSQTVAAGELLVAVIRYPSGLTTIAADDTGWQLAVVVQAQSLYTSLWYKIATGSEGDSTWTMSSGSGWDVQARRFTGVDPTSPLDRTASVQGSSTTVTSRSSGTTAATQAADELLVAGWGVDNNVTWNSLSNSFAFLLPTQSDNPRMTAGYQILTAVAGSTYESTASWTTLRKSHGVIATFRPLAAVHATASAPTLSMTAGLGAPTVTPLNVTAQPALIASIAAIPAVTVVAVRNATIITVALSTTSSIPTPHLSQTAIPATLSTTISLAAPVVLLTDTVYPAVIATTSTVPAATPLVTILPSPVTITTSSSVPAAAVSTSQASVVTTIYTTTQTPAVSVSVERGFLGILDTVVTTVSVGSPTVTVTSNASVPASDIYTIAVIGSVATSGIETEMLGLLWVELMAKLNQLAGTTALELDGAANAWAGTYDLPFIAALNAKAGTVGLEFNAVAKRLALQNGGDAGMDAHGAILSIPVGGVSVTPTSATQAVSTIATAASLPTVTVGA